MVEFHGWIAINQSIDGEEEEDMASIVNEIEKVISTLHSTHLLTILKPINGTFYLHLSGKTNHRGEDVEEIFGLINLISVVAKGSYGILYFRDDEDKSGRHNEFVIYKIARGEITIEKDQLLSPCNPVIEE